MEWYIAEVFRLFNLSKYICSDFYHFLFRASIELLLWVRIILCWHVNSKIQSAIRFQTWLQLPLTWLASNSPCLGWGGGKRDLRKRRVLSVSAQQKAEVGEAEEAKVQEEQGKVKQQPTQPRPVEPQLNVKSKNMSREYGGQWLSSGRRHVRIYACLHWSRNLWVRSNAYG